MSLMDDDLHDPEYYSDEPPACPDCDDVGEVAVNFGLHSTGMPSIKRCPSCTPAVVLAITQRRGREYVRERGLLPDTPVVTPDRAHALREYSDVIIHRVYDEPLPKDARAAIMMEQDAQILVDTGQAEWAR